MNRSNESSPLRRYVLAVWSAVGTLLLLWIVIWLIGRLRIIWAPLVLAVAFVYLLNPLVKRLEQRRVHRLLGSCLSYLLLAGLLTLVGFLVVPMVREQGVELAGRFPTLVSAVTDWFSDVAGRLGVEFDLPGVDSLQDWLSRAENQEQLQDIARRALSVVGGVVEAVVVFILAPVLAFYLLADLTGLAERARALVPEGARAEALHVMAQVNRAVGGFVRGQLLVALIVGVLSSVGLRIINLPFWLIIGLIAGLLNMVPFIGPWVGGALGVLVALVEGDFTKAVWAALVFLAIQQFDNHFVTPTVLRATVKLHPVLVILSLLVGGSVAGLLGVLVAVPLTAVVKIVIGHLWRTRALGESWDEAAEAMIVEYEPPSRERLVSRLRRIRDLQVSTGGVAHPVVPHPEPEESDEAEPIEPDAEGEAAPPDDATGGV